MKFISHRGNISESNPAKENNPDYIYDALKDFHCLVDIWSLKNRLYLGTDQPTYNISTDFVKNNKLFFNCKNRDALKYMIDKGVSNDYFCLDNEYFNFTSNGLLIVNYKMEPLDNSIMYLPENMNNFILLSKCYGICSDNIKHYYQLYANEK
jgi:hypothetical protein